MIPMVSVRVMPTTVVDRLREAFRILDEQWRDQNARLPHDIEEVRGAIKTAYKLAIAVQSREDKEELARRKFVEESMQKL